MPNIISINVKLASKVIQVDRDKGRVAAVRFLRESLSDHIYLGLVDLKTAVEQICGNDFNVPVMFVSKDRQYLTCDLDRTKRAE